MEETYWNKFMASGKVDDYLEYTEESKSVIRSWSIMADHHDAGTEVRRSESDNGYGNGAICCSDRRV